jgi:cysteine desulfurase / selenocysteine lyase
MAAYNDRRAEIQRLTAEDFTTPLDRCRRAAAALIGASPEEIALGGNTSFGINLAAAALPVEKGRRIVVSDREFPANIYPWMRRARDGVPLEIVRTGEDGHPDEERLAAAVAGGGVGILALSSVQFVDGYRMDLERLSTLCREQDTFLVIDGIQSLGHLPIDVSRIRVDVLATGGHKWLLGPFGTGFAYVRRDLQPRIEPGAVGWTAMPASDDIGDLLDYGYAFHPDARKFEVGTPPFQDFSGWAASLELLLEEGMERIRAHVLALAEEISEILADTPGRVTSDRSPRRRSAIVGFRPRDAGAVRERLATAGVQVAEREGILRFSPHLYNTRQDVDRLRKALA